jgi:hypothetical protein
MNSAVAASASRSWMSTTVRVLCAVLGGYAFSAALVALLAVALPLAFGLARSEAVVLASMLGFVCYLLVLLWAFAERQVWRVWTMPVGGAIAIDGLTRLLSPLLTTQS